MMSSSSSGIGAAGAGFATYSFGADLNVHNNVHIIASWPLLYGTSFEEFKELWYSVLKALKDYHTHGLFTQGEFGEE